jgi:hypothetical protein
MIHNVPIDSVAARRALEAGQVELEPSSAIYIAQMCAEMAKLAESANLGLARRFFLMAQMEAEEAGRRFDARARH